jgi:PII-like signaling protein
VTEPPVPPRDSDGTWFQKLMVFAGEQDRYEGRALHAELVRALRRDGAAGATTVRAVWGYSSGQEPSGDRFMALRRSVPMITVVIDTPERVRRWLAPIDRIAPDAVVTSEFVPRMLTAGARAVLGTRPVG